jgi:hypothetical protein
MSTQYTSLTLKRSETRVYLPRIGGSFDVGNCLDAESLARRIVACVNACAGLPTELLETGALLYPTMREGVP